MRHLEVACAIIEGDGRVLAAQRSAAMSLPLKWEFPGGKIGGGETPEEARRHGGVIATCTSDVGKRARWRKGRR